MVFPGRVRSCKKLVPAYSMANRIQKVCSC